MFEKKKISTRLIANLGVAVTFAVTLAACSHEAIHQADNTPIPAEDLKTTSNDSASLAVPDPMDAPPAFEKLADNSARAPRRFHRHRHAHSIHKLARRHHVTKNMIARVQEKSEVNGPTPTAPASTNEISTGSLTAAAANLPTVSDDVQDSLNDNGGSTRLHLLLGLGAIVLASGGLLWFALRRSGARGKRRLVFNT